MSRFGGGACLGAGGGGGGAGSLGAQGSARRGSAAIGAGAGTGATGSGAGAGFGAASTGGGAGFGAASTGGGAGATGINAGGLMDSTSKSPSSSANDVSSRFDVYSRLAGTGCTFGAFISGLQGAPGIGNADGARRSLRLSSAAEKGRLGASGRGS